MRPIIIASRCLMGGSHMKSADFIKNWHTTVQTNFPRIAESIDYNKFLKVGHDLGVRNRYFFEPYPFTSFDMSLEQRNKWMLEEQKNLISGDLVEWCKNNNIPVKDIGAVMTMYNEPEPLPGLEWPIYKLLKLPPTVQRYAFRNYWCGGGSMLFSRAYDYLIQHPNKAVLLYTALNGSYYPWSMYQKFKSISKRRHLNNDTDGMNTSSVFNAYMNAIFGNDSCGYAVIIGSKLARKWGIIHGNNKIYLEMKRYIEHNIPEPENGASLSIGENGSYLQLPTQVISEHVGTAFRDMYSKLLGRTKLSDIPYKFIHPGGKMVIDAISKHCNIDSGELSRSEECLKHGNNTSVTVFWMLDQWFKEKHPDPNKLWTMGGQGLGSTFVTVLGKTCYIG